VWLSLVACYVPPDLPLQGEVPIVAAPTGTCRDGDDVTVTCVLDGDTFCGDDGELVRMIGIDAPETEEPGIAADCFADEAWDWLADTIEGEEVTLGFDRTCTDVSGRTLAWVWIRGDALDAPDLEPWITEAVDSEEPAVLLNEVMLGEGYARPYPEEIAGTLVFQDRLDRAAAAAEQSARGLWTACNGDD
jgi:endonuclease YncB( thermonuclease family)